LIWPNKTTSTILRTPTLKTNSYLNLVGAYKGVMLNLNKPKNIKKEKCSTLSLKLIWMEIIYKRVQCFWDLHKYVNTWRIFVRSPCTKTLYLYYKFKFDPCNANLNKLHYKNPPSLNRSSLDNINCYNNFSHTHNMPSWTFNILRNNVMTRSDYLHFLTMWKRQWIELRTLMLTDNEIFWEFQRSSKKNGGMMQENDDALSAFECEQNEIVMRSPRWWLAPCPIQMWASPNPKPHDPSEWNDYFFRLYKGCCTLVV
jgi:hypothetical protein